MLPCPHAFSCLRSSAAEVPGLLDTDMNASRHRSFENGSSKGEVKMACNLMIISRLCFLAVVHNFNMRLSVSSQMIVCYFDHLIDTWSTVQVSKVAVEKDTWKRCSAHVHISHLIQNLQMPENQGRLLLQSNQLRLQKGPNLGARMALNSFHGVGTSFNGTISSTTSCNSTDERNSNEAKTGILCQQQLHQDQPHAALASEACTSQKQVSLYCNCQRFLPFQFFSLPLSFLTILCYPQSFDFLSLFAGGGGVEVKNSGNRTGNGLDPSSQHQVPYLQSLAQQQTLLPFAMPQTRYASAAYPDQLSITSSAANKVLFFLLGHIYKCVKKFIRAS